MDEETLSANLKYLIRKYVEDRSLADELISEVEEKGPSVLKGALHQIEISSKKVDDEDGILIKKMYFYFC